MCVDTKIGNEPSDFRGARVPEAELQVRLYLESKSSGGVIKARKRGSQKP